MIVFMWITLIFTIYFICGLKTVNQYERCIVFTLGKYTAILKPGLRFVWPIFQRHHRIDIRKSTEEISTELNQFNLPPEITKKILSEIQGFKDKIGKYYDDESVKKD